MKIIDMMGKPFEFDTQVQTQKSENESRLGHLKSAYAEHPSTALTPQKAARLLINAEQGDLASQSALAEDMQEKDAHLFSEISKRRNAVSEVDWQIVAPRNATPQEQADAELIQEILQDATWFNEAIYDLTDAILKGYACLEIEWEPSLVSGLRLIKTVHYRDATWFTASVTHPNEIRLNDNSNEGIALQPFGWITHIAKAKTGYLSRIGLVRTLIWPYLYKNYSARDFAEFLEIYGLPLRLGKYPEGATQAEKDTLLRAVMGIGHNAGGIIPQGMEIDFRDAANGDGTPFLNMMSWAEKSMSKAILGGTLTSQADGVTSTNALGNVHNDVRKELRNADLKRLESTLNRDLIYPLYALNGRSFNDVRRLPRIEFDTSEPADIASLANSLSQLVDVGMKIPVSWAHEQMQIPVASDSEDILSRQAQNLSMMSANGSAQTAMLSAQTHEESIDPLTLGEQALLKVEPSDERLDKATEVLIAPIVKAYTQGEYAQAKDVLATLGKDLSADQLTAVMGKSLFLANLLGQSFSDKE